MRVGVKKNNEGDWGITPLSGKFCGICIAHADEIALGDPCQGSLEVTGELVSVWGMTIIDQRVFDDEETLTGLCIGKPFVMEMKMDRSLFHANV